MRKSSNIVRASAEDLKAMRERGESRTDWERVRATTQPEADRLADQEDGALPEGWERTIENGIPALKKEIHIRLDGDVLDWFRSQGRGYQTRINAVLKAYMRAKAEDSRSERKSKRA